MKYLQYFMCLCNISIILHCNLQYCNVLAILAQLCCVSHESIIFLLFSHFSVNITFLSTWVDSVDSKSLIYHPPIINQLTEIVRWNKGLELSSSWFNMLKVAINFTHISPSFMQSPQRRFCIQTRTRISDIALIVFHSLRRCRAPCTHRHAGYAFHILIFRSRRELIVTR